MADEDTFEASSFEDPFSIKETDEDRDLYSNGRGYAPSSPPTLPDRRGLPSPSSSSPSFPSSSSSSAGASLERPGSSGAGGARSGEENVLAATLAPQMFSLPTSAFGGLLGGAGGQGAAPNAAGAQAAVGSSGGQYLSYGRRSLWGQTAYNVGYSYFGGLALGGALGAFLGMQQSPNWRPRIVLNSVLNGSGKIGARAGNGGGVLAIMYTLLERQLEDMEVDTLPGRFNNLVGADVFSTQRQRLDWTVPVTSAFLSGALFTLPRALTMRGLESHYVTPIKRVGVMAFGGIAAVATVAFLSVVGPVVFGHRSPFRLSN